MNKKVRKCPKCGVEIELGHENHPLKHVCTECGGKARRRGRDPRSKKRERREGKEEDKPLNFKDHSQLNRKTWKMRITKMPDRVSENLKTENNPNYIRMNKDTLTYGNTIITGTLKDILGTILQERGSE